MTDLAPAKEGWLGRISLEFVAWEGGSRLQRREHEGPLRIQRAFYPEGPGVPHVYLLHPPGGVVGGDRLQTEVLMRENASALLTTPAAQKLYRSARATAQIENRLELAAGASLEWFPSETLAFEGANVASVTRVSLAESAAFIGWEILCFGMPAKSLGFRSGHVLSRFELFRAERPLLLESLDFESGQGLFEAAYGLRGRAVTANLFVIPRSGSADAWVEPLRALLPAPTDSLQLGATSLGELLVVRASAASVEIVRAAFLKAWQLLRPLVLARAAVLPRIWAT